MPTSCVSAMVLSLTHSSGIRTHLNTTTAQSPSAQHLLSTKARIGHRSGLSAGQVQSRSVSVSPEGVWVVVSLSVPSIPALTLTSCYWCLTCSLNSPATSGLIHFLLALQAASRHAAHTCWRLFLHETSLVGSLRFSYKLNQCNQWKPSLCSHAQLKV